MSDLVEMLQAQIKAINDAYLQGLQHGREQGLREGREAGLEEARKLMEAKFPDMKLPVTP